MRNLTFLLIAIVISFNTHAQNKYYYNANGAYTKNEEQAICKVETSDFIDNTIRLTQSLKSNGKWKKAKLVSVAEKISENKYKIYGPKKSENNFVIREVLDTISFGYKIKETDESGKTLFIADCLTIFPLILHGTCTTFDASGLEMASLSYLKNECKSEKFLFRPSNKNGVELSKNPEFPGGYRNFRIKIARNVKYPISSQKNKEDGMVYLKFMINEKGKMEQITSARNEKGALTKEGIRTISSIKEKWQPAEINGEKVSAWHYTKISFNVGSSILHF